MSMTEIEKIILTELKEIKDTLKDLPCSVRGERFAKLESRVDHISGWLKGVVGAISGIMIYLISRAIQNIFGGGQ